MRPLRESEMLPAVSVPTALAGPRFISVMGMRSSGDLSNFFSRARRAAAIFALAFRVLDPYGEGRSARRSAKAAGGSRALDFSAGPNI